MEAVLNDFTFQGTGGGANSAASYQPEQELLGLNHLKKLYTEFSQPPAPLSSAEKVKLSRCNSH